MAACRDGRSLYPLFTMADTAQHYVTLGKNERPAAATGPGLRMLPRKGNTSSGHRSHTQTVPDAIISIVYGPDWRIFAAHESVLCQSPFRATTCRSQSKEEHIHRISLLQVEPEVFSRVLQYLYEGDYNPFLTFDHCQDEWLLTSQAEAIIHLPSYGTVLIDSVIYCLAAQYGLDKLKQLALRKQGLQLDVIYNVILATACYIFDNTTDTDWNLQDRYISYVIRLPNMFMSRGQMQEHIEIGGEFVYELFMAMSRHMEHLSRAA